MRPGDRAPRPTALRTNREKAAGLEGGPPASLRAIRGSTRANSRRLRLAPARAQWLASDWGERRCEPCHANERTVRCDVVPAEALADVDAARSRDRAGARAAAGARATGAPGDQLVTACLPFVISIALEYRRWGVPARGHRPAGQPRAPPRGDEVRPGQGVPPRDVRGVLDPRRDPRVRRPRLPRRSPRDDQGRAARAPRLPQDARGDPTRSPP